jgi:hypothetical protein
MPEIIPLGWFHTIVGGIAIASAIYTLVRHGKISPYTRSGQVYLLATAITAGTALAIYQHGGFTPAHSLAILTFGALGLGTVAAMTQVFGSWSPYIHAVSYSATMLFHSIPALTDGLLRLPVGDPILSSIEDPVLKQCYLGLFALFLVGVTAQFHAIRRQRAT